MTGVRYLPRLREVGGRIQGVFTQVQVLLWRACSVGRSGTYSWTWPILCPPFHAMGWRVHLGHIYQREELASALQWWGQTSWLCHHKWRILQEAHPYGLSDRARLGTCLQAEHLVTDQLAIVSDIWSRGRVWWAFISTCDWPVTNKGT